MLFSEQTATMITAPATIGDIEETVLASGTLKPVKLVAVGAQASGRVTSLKVSLGQMVRAGDLIAEIDSLTQQNSLRTAQATLAYTRAQRLEKEASLVLAEATLARQQLTWAQKASSRADYDSAEATVKTTRAQIAQLDAQIVQAEVGIETARINLDYTRITAPIDGTVLSTVTQEGQTVNAVQSAPTIVILGQLDTMTVRAEISEADVVRVRPGQPVYFTILGDRDHRHYARLDSIEPAPESIRNDSSFSATNATTANSSSSSSSSSTSAVYYNGIFTIPNTDRKLRTYMTAEVHIVLAEARKVLTIPAAALGNASPDGASTVRIAESGGRIKSRTIKIGLNNKITVEVKAGLREGEHVVIGEKSRGASVAGAVPPPPGEF
ncbi:efflux RND transporter periplasmic adaptor subunit [Bradyrhizobium sp. 200]|uniref:efflux RND transporter periplasmic adaptor subunit n=1 Tax=Bradyrhizobium sp. 200 TaxID=2782665 RepID=UPI003209BDD4